MKRRPETEPTISQMFALFEPAAREAFSFLISDYGFEHTGTVINVPQCEVLLRNTTTGAVILYEINDSPEVLLQKLTHTPPTNITVVEEYSVHFLIKERCPDKVIQAVVDDWDLETIRQILNDYSAALKECGRDILTGDFSIFPQLKLRARKNQERKNRELYG